MNLPTGGPLVVVTGVSGSGKSTVGVELARHLGVEYADADDFHPPGNVEKMRSGHALSEADREPWLAAIAHWLRHHAAAGGVASCSALRRKSRDQLREAAPSAVFLHLDGSERMLRQRLRKRADHFMPASLLESQLDALEPLGVDEPGMRADIESSPDAIVAAFLRWRRHDPIPR